ncbi:MAG: hypothetical protein EBT57_08575, partial [Verrucomicrobia bacterium]|nr:hypothetical protein [Verrucomicrobiota bacterium]
MVTLNSGTYGAINKTLESSISDDTTAKTSPILVYAATPGGVIINAPSQITLSGRGITLAGLDFNANSGIPTSAATPYILGTASGSRYMTFSNIRFNGCAAGATAGNWIYLQGFYHAVEFCTFQERPATISSPIISFDPNIYEGGVAVSRLHRISYCYFGPRYTGTGNGYETIRIATGDFQTFDMQVTIEHNLFYRSIWRTDGAQSDPEIISSKSRNNKILYNTILESQGGISLRAGDGSTVEGNYIFGAGSLSGASNIAIGTSSANQGGIRVIGTNHMVRNNYIENIVGTDARAALCVMSGETNYYQGNPSTGATNSGSYAPGHNAKIYNNTFVNCKEISLGYLSPDSTNAAGSPTNVLFYNNAWQGNGTATAAIKRDTTTAAGYSPIVLGGAGANYFYETSSGKLGWTTNYGLSNSIFTAVTNAGVSSNFDNYKVPTSSSPLLDKATNTLAAAYDVRGLARPT